MEIQPYSHEMSTKKALFIKIAKLLEIKHEAKKRESKLSSAFFLIGTFFKVILVAF